MTDTTTITTTVAIGGRVYVRQVQGTHWARDDDGRLYVYDDDTTVLDVGADNVVEILREDDVETVATIDSDNTTNATATTDSCQ
ncbi:hypothetical protein NDI85_21150 [Halomicroarcula sp. S1AR25-4]|uniref:hypothetical protein n=1 Tax=Haloarcula sp. S1AR25-4 TaxID=2950538 RepID=UPI00287699FB|nr:hypothetical protein [Halomicroarcula sp. S1AR25-4]MDS0280295.1 hypothetical protein [Halomicroarcula sp. S1AR25-4]